MPIETIYSGSADGVVINNTTGQGWSSPHGSGAGTSVDIDDVYEGIGVYCWDTSVVIDRCFLYFDLSEIIPGSAELTSVILYLCKKDVNPVNGAVLEAQKGTQQDVLCLNDYDAFEGALFGSADYTDGILSDGEYGVINFNEAGISYINTLVGAGTAKICVREYDYDYLNTDPRPDEYNADVYLAEETTYGNPKLVCVFSFDSCEEDLSVEFSGVDYWYTLYSDLKAEIAAQFPYSVLTVEIAAERESTHEICQLVVSPKDIAVALEEIHHIDISVPYSVQLTEKPSVEYPVIIEGYTQVTSIPSSSSQFYLDYSTGICYFYYTNAGNRIVISYYGLGSFIKANDLNKFSTVLGRLKNPIRGFKVAAMPVPERRVRMFGGFISILSAVTPVPETFIDFGPKGNFEIERMSVNYWKKLLIGITEAGGVIIEEGSAVPVAIPAAAPALSAMVYPCAILSVYDNGRGLIASINAIEQSQIEDVRNFVGGGV